jgi:exopolysaccharide biosynthesis polyprenyl glycosylphosphotransferase
MATSQFWQRLSASLAPSQEWEANGVGDSTPAVRQNSRTWMALDVVTILGSALLATLYKCNLTPLAGAREFWRGTLIHGRSMAVLLGLLAGFSIALIVASRRLNLYNPGRISSLLHEQRLSLQACVTSGLLLTGTLYLLHLDDIPRSIVLLTVTLVAVALGVRRLVYRISLYRRYERGLGTRNVLIVGTGPEAHALRHHLDSLRHLGYTFKGFITLPGTAPTGPTSHEVVGSLDTLFQNARKQFADEIFFTTPCERNVVVRVLDQARILGVDLRVVPDIFDGLAWNSPIEYIGQFPTIPLHCGTVQQTGLVFKRIFDLIFSAIVLILLAPVLLALALAVKLDSPGPVFYLSERIGKKGRVFRCCKFRTMGIDAEQRRAELLHKNERDGVLFKVSNDPRITRLGRILRKYSLDELPQFLNVLRGDMSVVGPRPPIASEVKEYKLSHLRRLHVTPGITGLWQVQGRQDPSFASYVSLDVTYIDNWSIWLDFKIILRTIGVVFAGTGS